MKGLATLIKLHKRKLDELRRQMGALENQKSQLQASIVKLQQELEHEMELAARQPEMANFFGGFAKRIKKRQEDMRTEIKTLDVQMEKLRGQIAIEFGEMKKFEIAKANAEKRAEEEQNRKDTIVLDEIAGQQHRRKQEQTS
jgi:flagellar export protein FliJ